MKRYLFQKKKEKKESTLVKWRVSKKQAFFKKYYHPESSFGSRNLMLGRKVVLKKYGWWRFFKKPEGLELTFFVNPELTFALFFLFYFFAFGGGFSLGRRFFLFRSRGHLARVSNFGAGKKTKS